MEAHSPRKKKQKHERRGNLNDQTFADAGVGKKRPRHGVATKDQFKKST